MLWDHQKPRLNLQSLLRQYFCEKYKKGRWGKPISGVAQAGSSQDDTTTHSGRSLPPNGRSPRGLLLPESQ